MMKYISADDKGTPRRAASRGLAVLALFASLSAAAAPIDEHRAASPQGSVEVVSVSGSIDIQGWDKPDVEVSGTVGKDVERVDITGDPDRISVRVVMRTQHEWGGSDASAHLVVRVPAASSISATVVSANLTVSQVHGSVKLQTVSGDVSGEVGGDLIANSVSGSVHLKAPAAKMIEVKTISGDIVLTGGDADTEVATVSGDATMNLGSLPHARFKTISGNLRAALAIAPQAQIDAESVSGDLSFGFAGAPAADFDVRTFSGDIDNCFGPKPTQSEHGPGSRLSFKTGDSQARVVVATKSGDVKMCNKS